MSGGDQDQIEAAPGHGTGRGPMRGRRTGRRARTAVTAGALAAAAAAAAGAVTVGGGGGNQAAASSELPPATAEVTKADLVDTSSQDGTLGYGDTHTIAAGQQGVLTWMPAEGRVIGRGRTLYAVNGKPVTLLYGSTPMYRRLAAGVSDGADVKQLETNLRALGYDGFTVDDHFTDGTADAVKEWQDDRGLDETGAVDVGQVIFRPNAVRVADAKLEQGDTAGPGAQLLSVTGTTRLVTVALKVTDERLARRGAGVSVELPGGNTVGGTISSVGTVAQTSSDDEGDSPNDQGDTEDATIDVTIRLAKTSSSAAIDQAPVTVEFTSDERKGVLTVPVAALLALREGGYGVQIVEGTASRIVPVQTGLFASGQVEISGDGIRAGQKVGVPAS